MPNEIQKPEVKEFDWVESKQGFQEIYGNYVSTSWTLVDVRFRIGQIIPVIGADPMKFVAEERGAVTVAWPQAKFLRDILTGLIANYEKVNGEIKPAKLPSVPD
jgi:hypothetical protein